MVETVAGVPCEANVVEMAEHDRSCVINALTDVSTRARFLLICRRFASRRLSCVFDRDRLARGKQHGSLVFARLANVCTTFAWHAPGYQPSARTRGGRERIAATTGGSVEIFTDAAASVQGADVVITDTGSQWARKQRRLSALRRR